MGNKMQVIIYVDGLNLFYRCQKKSNYYWLDIESLCHKIISQEFLIKNYDIIKIKYFATPYNEDKTLITSTAHVFNHYVETLKNHIKNFEYIEGNFKESKNVKMPLRNKIKTANGEILSQVRVIKQEEKNTDVNIATHILNDAWLDKYDCAVLISNDSDLSEALKLITKHHKNKRIGVICPVGRKKPPIEELSHYAYHNRRAQRIRHQKYVHALRRNDAEIKDSQLPDSLAKIALPKSWQK